MFDPLTSFGQLNDLKKTAQNTPKCGRNIRWHAFTGTLFNSDTEACIPIITFHFETSAPIKYKYMGSLCKIWKKMADFLQLILLSISNIRTLHGFQFCQFGWNCVPLLSVHSFIVSQKTGVIQEKTGSKKPAKKCIHPWKQLSAR